MSVYNERIKALARSLDNYPPLAEFDAELSVDNPLCGDRIDLKARCDHEAVEALHGEVRGCLLCQSSVAIVSAVARERSLSLSELEVAEAMLASFLAGDVEAEQLQAPWLDWRYFQPLQAHKSRHSCVLLVFDGLRALLEQTR